MGDTEDDLDHDDTISELAVKLFALGSVEATLDRIAAMAEATIDGCTAAGVSIAVEGAPVSLAVSNPFAATIEQIQREVGEGPCLDASAKGVTFYAHDLLEDARWPAFAAAATDAGVRCVLAYSLRPGPSALNLYSQYPDAFGVTDRAQGSLFATLAGLALDNAEQRAADAEAAVNLTAALRTRELIGQAQGILIERERITADQAFDILRRASQNLNVKLRDIAESLVQTGESPDPDPRQR